MADGKEDRTALAPVEVELLVGIYCFSSGTRQKKTP